MLRRLQLYTKKKDAKHFAKTVDILVTLIKICRGLHKSHIISKNEILQYNIKIATFTNL